MDEADVTEHERTEANTAPADTDQHSATQAFLVEFTDRLRGVSKATEIQRIAATLLGEHLEVNQAHYGETRPGKWTQSDIRLIQEAAERTWAAVDRARAEERLEESRARLQLALDAAKMGTWAWYPEEDREEVDGRTRQLFGLRENDRANLAAALSTFIHPNDRASYLAAVTRSLEPEGDGKFIAEYRVIHPDASLHWIQSIGQTVFEGAPPRATRMYGMLLDVTDRKRTECDLAFLADVTEELATLTSIEDTMNTLGEKIGAHFNVSRCVFSVIDEATGALANPHSWHQRGTMSTVRPFDTENHLSEAFWRAGRAGESCVVRDTTSDPRVNAADMTAIGVGAFASVPLVRDGRWQFSLTITNPVPRNWQDEEVQLLRELSMRIWTRVERARAEEALGASEEKYRTLFNSIDQGFCTIEVMFDEHGTAVDYLFLETNPAFARQTGIENSVGKLMRTMAPEHEAFWFETYGRVARTGEATRFEHESAAFGRFYDVYAFRIGAPGENRVAIIFNDIGERTQADRALHASLAEREALFRELQHRVKNNLQVITSLLEMQARKSGDPALRASLAEARHRVASIASIHEALYQSSSFSRVEMTNYARRLVSHLVLFYEAEGRVTASVTGQEVFMDLERAVPCGLVLNELVSNVCKHALPSPLQGELTVALHQGNGHIRMDVTDTGVGLPPDFDPRKSTTLGLQLVHLLTSQLGGTVAFHGEQGTSVEIRLPNTLNPLAPD